MKFAQQLPRAKYLRSRDEAILAACRDMTVLHLGFVDEGLLDERLAHGNWLHARLLQVAKRVVGVDVSAEGVARARALGYEDIYVGDVERLATEAIPKLDYDVILAADIIEHLENPGRFLAELWQVATARTKIVITTPNALSIKSLFYPLFRVEVVHPDHNCYFSPTTLTTLLRKHQFGVPEIGLYSSVWAPNRENVRGPVDLIGKLGFTAVDFVLQTTLVRLFPYYSEGMMVQARRTG